MGLVQSKRGIAMEVAGNPIAAALAAQAFAGQQFNRGPKKMLRRYFAHKGDAFDDLDDTNKRHVMSALENRARTLNCKVSDLAWALSIQKYGGVYGVLVKKWEDIERQEWQEKHV